MTCDDITAQLVDFLGEELVADVRETVEVHIRGCAKCEVYVATFFAPMPTTPANGMARPATRTPSTTATASITPRWETTRLRGRRSLRGTDMSSNVRERAGPDLVVITSN